MEKGKLYLLMDELLETKECVDSLEYVTERLLKAFREQNQAEGVNLTHFYKRQLDSLKTDIEKCLQTLDKGIINI